MTWSDETDGRDRGIGVLGAFLCGALTGAALAIMFAPAHGRDTRARLRSAARDVAANRNAYLASLESQLDEWSTTIDTLASRARAATAEVRSEYERQVADLRTRSENAQRLLGDLRTAGESAWQELATTADRAWRELRRAVANASSQPSRPTT